jgi:hypothetical protein
MAGRRPPPEDVSDLIPADSVRGAWASGYLWMRAGRYDLAWRSWERCPSDPRVHVSRGAACRELGLHDRAERHDLSAAASVDPAVSAAAAVGLVADAVGRGALDEARSRLDRARRAVSNLDRAPAAGRQRIRLGWVEVEVMLLAGDEPETPLPQLTKTGAIAGPPHYGAGTRHHLAKGLLFAGVVRRDLLALGRAATMASPGLRWAVHLARVDLGADGAIGGARRAWSRIVPPPHLIDEVTSVARQRGLTDAD